MTNLARAGQVSEAEMPLSILPVEYDSEFLGVNDHKLEIQLVEVEEQEEMRPFVHIAS